MAFIKKSFFSFLVVLFLALSFRSLVIEPFHIPSGSMKSTLLVGDYVLVGKYAYGYSRYSFPFSPGFFSGKIFSSPIKPGDVVVFRPPHEVNVNYVKRVIGIAGDKVQLVDGDLFINGIKMFRKRIEDFADRDSSGKVVVIARYTETLYNGKSYEILDYNPNSPLDNTPVYLVPPGMIFVLGDNRDNSRDSRFVSDIGFIPVENVIGKALVTVFSLKKNPDSWFHYGLRPDRIWHVIK